MKKNNSSTSTLSFQQKRFFATAINLFLLSIFFRTLGLSFSISAGFDLAGIEFVLKNKKDGIYQSSANKLKQQLTPEEFEQPILERYEVFKNSLFNANSTFVSATTC